MSEFGNKGPGPALKATLVSAMPAGHYNRRRTGAFVTDSSGDVFIAHRGCDAGRASRVLPALLCGGPSVSGYLATPIDEMNYIGRLPILAQILDLSSKCPPTSSFPSHLLF